MAAKPLPCSDDLGPIKFDFHNSEAQALIKSMANAGQEFEEAQLRYKYVLSVAGDSDAPNSDSIIALQHAGRDYASAIERHSNAVMAWLALVDRSR